MKKAKKKIKKIRARAGQNQKLKRRRKMNEKAEQGNENKPEQPKTAIAAQPKPVKNKGKIAVILLRSMSHIRHDMRKTLRLLNLFNQHNCVVIDDTPIKIGMVKKIKDFVTYGPVSEEVIKMLEKKNKLKGKTYKLNPPKKGFRRKGIKAQYVAGGALGKRDSMDELIKRML
ncbi:hypothetical protein GF371_02990 [Candidatus Woesearchaeota archaeon]|nr:hypothetical protein [Candidatus Woesearchaeota archaeon]